MTGGAEWVCLAMFRVALRLYPARVRDLFGDDMERTFAAELEARARPGPSRARLWHLLRTALFVAQTLGAVLGDALSERLRSLLPSQRPPNGTDIMPGLAEDTLGAVRSLYRNPTFALAVIGTLAVAAGAGTAVVSVVDSVLLRPLPYREPEGVVVLWERNLARGSTENVVHPLNLQAWRSASTTLEEFAAIFPASFTLDLGSERYRAAAVMATPSFFPLLGVEPALGRWPAADESRAAVVLLGHALWRDRFGADPDVVGRAITLGSDPYTVVGVMPASFRPLRIGWIQDQELWVPLEPTEGIGGRALIVLARLRPGETRERTREEMAGVARRLSESEARNEGWDVQVVGLEEQVVGGVRDLLWVLLAGTGLVLVIACVNVGGLILARTRRRRGELHLRAALGAGSTRIARQLVLECGVLSLAGAAGGVLMGAWILAWARPLLPASMPRLDEVGVGFVPAVGVAALMVMLLQVASVLPALRRDPLHHRPALAARAGGPSPARQGTLVGQVALAVLLSLGAGLVIRSFQNLTAVDLGFDPEDVLALRVSLGAGVADPEHRAEVFDRIVERARALPEVASAGAVSVRPLGGLTVSTRVWAADQAPEPDDGSPSASIRQATPGYLEAAGIRLIQGRDFGTPDGADAPLRAIVTEGLARTLWPEGDWLGRPLGVSLSGGLRAEVVGVAEHVRYEGIEEEGRPSVLLAFSQSPQSSMDLIVRGSAGAPGVAALRGAVLEADPGATIYRVSGLEESVAAESAERRFSALLLGAFSLVAVMLAAVGIFGVVAGDVSARRFEIAVRLALGAKPARLLGHVMASSLLGAALGVLLGLGAGLLATPLLSSILFAVSPTDAPTYVGVGAFLLGVAALATLVPALRALRFDPAWTMRAQ